MNKKEREYDVLPPIPYGTRPKVALVGNGLNRSFEGAKETDKIIRDQWAKHYDSPLPDEIWKLPLPLQVVAATQDNVDVCLREFAQAMKDTPVSEKQKDFLMDVMSTRFDAILSTNYSLEFEKSVLEPYSDGRVRQLYRVTQKQTASQKSFGIFQCTRLPAENNPLLWHIHGTALRKDSLIMGHQYYGKLLAEVIARAYAVNRGYRQATENQAPFIPKSWIDYFLIGDVYVFGFGMDLSESDIWWLLSFKKSAFKESKVCFYQHEIKKESKLMLDSYGVRTPVIDFAEKDYVNYYRRVCESIKTETEKSDRNRMR